MKIYNKIFFCLFLFSNILFSQDGSEPVQITGDNLFGMEINGENIRKVVNNVVIIQGDVKITCDSAIQYIARNEVKLSGNVILTQDTIVILTPEGYYYGNKKIAFSNTGIILNDGHVTLSAVNGNYFFDEHKALFFDNVLLYDSLSTLKSDTLYYYHAEVKAVAIKNVEIRDTSSSISSDSLIHYRDTKISYAYSNIKITNKDNNVVITGQYLFNKPDSNYSMITGSPLLTQIDSVDSNRTDTLLIASELMETLGDTNRIFIATDSVKIIREGFASLNEKTIFKRASEEIVTYKICEDAPPPILWSDLTQLSGDSIHIFLIDNQLELINVNKNAFILSDNENFPYRYDQISGDSVKMYFDTTGLRKTEVYGNVLSIYYMYEDSLPNGLIKSSAERAKMFFENKKVIDVKLYGSPVTEYHPENLVEGLERSFTLPSFRIFPNKPNKSDLLRRNNKLIQ